MMPVSSPIGLREMLTKLVLGRRMFISSIRRQQPVDCISDLHSRTLCGSFRLGATVLMTYDNVMAGGSPDSSC